MKKHVYEMDDALAVPINIVYRNKIVINIDMRNLSCYQRGLIFLTPFLEIYF